MCVSELGTGKEKCISKERTGKEFYSQKWGPEKNCDPKTGTRNELWSQTAKPTLVETMFLSFHKARSASEMPEDKRFDMKNPCFVKFTWNTGIL